MNFKREAQRIRREQQNAPYRYKCAVCGRTDADHPELEFRYCSRCAGITASVRITSTTTSISPNNTGDMPCNTVLPAGYPFRR